MGKLDHLEKRLRAIKGGEDYAFDNLEELFLVPNIITPPKFKVLDFDKYRGTTCPENHLKMYCRKMGAYAKDKKLLIHSFQGSLTGGSCYLVGTFPSLCLEGPNGCLR